MDEKTKKLLHLYTTIWHKLTLGFTKEERRIIADFLSGEKLTLSEGWFISAIVGCDIWQPLDRAQIRINPIIAHMVKTLFDAGNIEITENQDAESSPRYREEVKDCKIEDFAIDSPQRNVLSASVLELHQNGYIHVVTISKLTTQGILSGLHLFKTNPLWLMQHLDENELQAIENLFVGAHLNWVVPKDNLTEDQKTFLKTPIADVALSVRMYSCIMSYNNGRTIEQQCLTVGDIYMTSKHDVLKKMKAGKKQISELTGLFEDHGLTWS